MAAKNALQWRQTWADLRLASVSGRSAAWGGGENET